jgi:hypothetical protein
MHRGDWLTFGFGDTTWIGKKKTDHLEKEGKTNSM